MRPSVEDAANMLVVVNALQLRLTKLTETNTKIKKQILKFKELSEAQRKEVRQMMHEAMKLAETVQTGVKK